MLERLREDGGVYAIAAMAYIEPVRLGERLLFLA